MVTILFLGDTATVQLHKLVIRVILSNYILTMGLRLGFALGLLVITFFFLTKSLLVTQFLKAVTQTPEAHTKSTKPDTDYQPLTQFSIS